MIGKLFLIPVPLSEATPREKFSAYHLNVVQGLKFFIAEDLRTARRNLKFFQYPEIGTAEIMLLNEHNNKEPLEHLLQPLLAGNNVGLMSDAGCPAIADPGAEIVKLAHSKGIEVEPLSGPSSILFGVMCAGFNGQNFAFNGYLPPERDLRERKLRELEKQALISRQAQFFIETPYRSVNMLESCINALKPSTLLFLGADMESSKPFYKTAPAISWQKFQPEVIHKKPVVFGIWPF